MKTLRYSLMVGLLSTALTACSSSGNNSAADSTITDTVAKAPKKDDDVFKLRMDTIQVVTVDRNPNDTANSRPVH